MKGQGRMGECGRVVRRENPVKQKNGCDEEIADYCQKAALVVLSAGTVTPVPSLGRGKMAAGPGGHHADQYRPGIRPSFLPAV